MDRSDVIYLISESKTQDAFGVWKSTYTEKMVFCNVSSVTATEFFEGGRNGFKPQFRMTVFFGDYSGEEIVKYNGKSYAIYRTYQSGTDSLELYVEQKGGADGKQESNA